MKPIFSGEALLRRVSAGGEAVFLLDDTEALRALLAREGHSSQRFAMVLVRIGDDEHPAMDTPTAPELRWGTLDTGLRLLDRIEERKPSNQCALLCMDPGFGWYIYTHKHDCPAGTMPKPRQDDVVKWTREILQIETRAQLDDDTKAWDRWRNMKDDYRAWLVEEKSNCR